MLFTEPLFYNGVGIPYSKMQSMVFNHGASSCINETDGSIVKRQFECMNSSSPNALKERAYVSINVPDVLQVPEFFEKCASIYLNGSPELNLGSHANFVTQKRSTVNLSQYGFRPKQVLKQRGALKKYFEGTSTVENNQQNSKTWVRDFCK